MERPPESHHPPGPLRGSARLAAVVLCVSALAACELDETAARFPETASHAADEPESHARAVPATKAELAGAPAVRYGHLTRSACEAELMRRAIPVESAAPARGVLSPLRLRGPLHGVVFRGSASPKGRTASPYEIADCRLLLALDDLAVLLAAHDVVEVVHYSMYRPPDRHWPDGKLGTRHTGALAIDAATFVLRNGARVSVEKDFNGRVGGVACGSEATMSPVTTEALFLRQITCEIAESRIFNVELTPMYNRPHYNHLHLEVTPNASWFLVH